MSVMTPPNNDGAFTPSVKKIQKRLGLSAQDVKMEPRGGWQHMIHLDLSHFLAERDSFCFGTSNACGSNAEGQLSIQHRGGPQGVLNVFDEHTVAFADFGGNRQ